METSSKENSQGNTENSFDSDDDGASSPPPNASYKKDEAKKPNEKNYEQVMKSISALPSADEKISALCKKYTQANERNRTLRYYIKQTDKRQAILIKEKERLQLEFNKNILIKSKLENICRELQKQNKAIKEESLLKIREEEERRKETQAKFQSTLTAITILLQQNNEKNQKLRDDNTTTIKKFQGIVEQYQLREEQVEKMAKQMNLESQLAGAKLEKANLEFQAEKERYTAELQQLTLLTAQYKVKIMELQSKEAMLTGQLEIYTDKYDEFQSALVKSNKVFGGFKEEMETMSKKIRKLEEESLSWKKKWELSQKVLLDMCGDKQTSEDKQVATQRQLQHMQSLCRTLQAERTVLLNALKENNIERPALPTPLPVCDLQVPPPSPSQSDKKVDAMVANCAQLRQSLAHLQSQLNVLAPSKDGNKEEPSKSEKPKKSKAKKSKAEKHAEKAGVEKTDVAKESENSVEELSLSKLISDNADQQKGVTHNQNEAVDVPQDKMENVAEKLIEASETNDVVIEKTEVKNENVHVVNAENNQNEQNVPSENLKEDVDGVPKTNVEIPALLQVPPISNEIP